MNRLSAHYKRVLQTSALAVPVALSLFLVSCTSTGSSLDIASAGLQPSLTTPLPTNPPQSAQTASNATIPVTAPQTEANMTLTVPEPNPTSPTGVQVVETPAAEQLDQNSKLVATAAAAASTNASVNAAAPGTPVAPDLNTATSETAIVDAASGASTQKATTPPADTQIATSLSATPAPAGASSGQKIALQDNPVSTQQAILTSAPNDQQILTAASAETLVAPAPPKKKTLFDSLFASKKEATPRVNAQPEALPATQLALATTAGPKPAKVAVEPVLQPAKLDLSKLEQPLTNANEEEPAVDNGELPGVRKGALFEIKRRDSLQDDTDIDIGETDHGPVLLASAGGMARLAPNGLKVQRESVDVACLKPQLVKILKKIERHYNSSVVVTSGYRSPGYNRRVRGAKNSLHMFCAAADIQVVGVGKWELARYARSMPGRGGVGTYCHTDSIHIDVGPDRDWNWRCSRRKK